MYQGQWPPRPRGPIKFEAALTFITEKASLGSSSNKGKHPSRGVRNRRSSSPSHSRKCWHPPNNSMEPTRPARVSYFMRY